MLAITIPNNYADTPLGMFYAVDARVKTAAWSENLETDKVTVTKNHTDDSGTDSQVKMTTKATMKVATMTREVQW